jgi:endonuclease VIII
MPEGDTIHHAARRLREVLVGREVVRFDTPGRGGFRPRRGETVAAVEARGKHLLVHFSGGMSLHTHLGMTGDWRVHPAPGPDGPRVRARIATSEHAAVCTAAPTVEVTTRPALERHPQLRLLGPDLCEPSVDLDEVLERIDRFTEPETETGVLLLDQRVASGIGNVYRSEVLHARGVNPRTPIAQLDADARRGLFATASELLRANVARPGPRTTVAGGLAVYGRTRRMCPRCGAAVRAERLGSPPRTVYWCPRCQPRSTAP